MDRHYSTLELTQHDETARAPELSKHDGTARAPERDYDTAAPELDSSALAPETVPDITPQVLYDSILPEAYGNEKPTQEHSHVTKLTQKWPWIVLGLLLAVAIAVGVSIGIWHRRAHKISSPQAPPPLYILNDTSLAAVSLSNGDRHLFFQDNTGLIRRAIRTESNGQWTTSPNLNASIGSKPKRFTPLTAMGPVSILDISLSLYYVSEDHTVSLSILTNDSWAPDPFFANYSTAVDTRSLSVSLLPGFNASFSVVPLKNLTANVALLYYENPNGNVSALLYRITEIPASNGEFYLQDHWVNITSQASNALPHEFRNTPGYNYSSMLDENGTFSHTLYEADPNAAHSTPFTSAPNFLDTSAGALFFSPNNSLLNAASPLAGGSFFSTGYTAGLTGPGTFSGTTRRSADYSLIHQSDIATFGSVYGIWINGTQPVLIETGGYDKVMLPNNEFPFTRLASATSADSSTTYLYHQINGTTFAEEVWDDALEHWLSPEYIIVSDS